MVAVAVRNATGIVGEEFNMRSKEELLRDIEICVVNRPPNGDTTCRECYFVQCGHATVVCRELMEEIYQYLKESDKNAADS